MQYLCLLVSGFHFATAVSLIGLKNIDPSIGDTAKPIPCDDFFPTNSTGNSTSNDIGPNRNADVFIENNLLWERVFIAGSQFLYSIKLKQFIYLSVASGWKYTTLACASNAIPTMPSIRVKRCPRIFGFAKFGSGYIVG